MGRERHSMDMVFALVLFAVFAISSMLLVLLGAGVYGRVAQGMNKVDTPVMLSYITEKLRCSEGKEAVTVLDGSRLLLQEETESGSYVTWIYVEDGYLKETFMPEGREPVENAGSVIGAVQEFEIREVTERMLEISVTDDTGASQVRYYEYPV